MVLAGVQVDGRGWRGFTAAMIFAVPIIVAVIAPLLIAMRETVLGVGQCGSLATSAVHAAVPLPHYHLILPWFFSVLFLAGFWLMRPQRSLLQSPSGHGGARKLRDASDMTVLEPMATLSGKSVSRPLVVGRYPKPKSSMVELQAVSACVGGEVHSTATAGGEEDAGGGFQGDVQQDADESAKCRKETFIGPRGAPVVSSPSSSLQETAEKVPSITAESDVGMHHGEKTWEHDFGSEHATVADETGMVALPTSSCAELVFAEAWSCAEPAEKFAAGVQNSLSEKHIMNFSKTAIAPHEDGKSHHVFSVPSSEAFKCDEKKEDAVAFKCADGVPLEKQLPFEAATFSALEPSSALEAVQDGNEHDSLPWHDLLPHGARVHEAGVQYEPALVPMPASTDTLPIYIDDGLCGAAGFDSGWKVCSPKRASSRSTSHGPDTTTTSAQCDSDNKHAGDDFAREHVPPSEQKATSVADMPTAASQWKIPISLEAALLPPVQSRPPLGQNGHGEGFRYEGIDVDNSSHNEAEDNSHDISILPAGAILNACMANSTSGQLSSVGTPFGATLYDGACVAAGSLEEHSMNSSAPHTYLLLSTDVFFT